MYCNQCGKQIPENSNFCPHCGAKNLLGNSENLEKASINNQNNHKEPPSILLVISIIPLLGCVYCLLILFGGREYDVFGTHGSHSDICAWAIGTGIAFLFLVIHFLRTKNQDEFK